MCASRFIRAGLGRRKGVFFAKRDSFDKLAEGDEKLRLQMRFLTARETVLVGKLEFEPKALRHLRHVYAPSIACFDSLNTGHVIVH